MEQIGFLKEHLVGLTGALFLEFNIPRMGRRIDAVLLVGPVVFVIEFKVGESEFDRAAVDQVWDYALDLKNFHEASHSVSIVPILVATGATASAPLKLHADDDKVYRPMLVHPGGFREAVDLALRTITGEVLDERTMVDRTVSSDTYDRGSCAGSLCSAFGRSHRALRCRSTEPARHFISH